MGFAVWTLGAPLLLVVTGIVVAFVLHPNNGPAAPFFMVGIVWLMFTSRARKTYWNARVRARANHDARRARSYRT